MPNFSGHDSHPTTENSTAYSPRASATPLENLTPSPQMNTEPIYAASQSPASSHGSPLSQSTHTTTQTQPTEPNPSSHTTESQPQFQPRRHPAAADTSTSTANRWQHYADCRPLLACSTVVACSVEHRCLLCRIHYLSPAPPNVVAFFAERSYLLCRTHCPSPALPTTAASPPCTGWNVARVQEWKGQPYRVVGIQRVLSARKLTTKRRKESHKIQDQAQTLGNEK
nr:hypothetical protein Itr_chr01CG04690 [Ipomoea trifida]